MPCFVLRSLFPHVHMFRSTCLGFYAMFFYVLFLFLLYVDVRVTCLHAYMLDIMSMVMSCLDLHVCMQVLCSYAYIRVFTCLYAWIHAFPCLCAKFLYVYMHVSMPICLYLCFHMFVCLDLCSLHVSCYFPCACALYAMFVCLDLVRTYVFHLLRTYVILLCDWLILWKNALYLYLGRYRMCLILQETCCSSLVLKPWRLDQETSEEKLFIKDG